MKAKIPDEIITSFNDFTEKVSIDDRLYVELDHSKNLAGKVEREFLITDDVLLTHQDFFIRNIIQMISTYDRWTDTHFSDIINNKKDFVIQAKGAWIVQSYPGCFNPPHTHPDCDFSCVGYLRLPPWSAEHEKNAANGDVEGGNLEFIYGMPNGFNCTSMKIRPVVGDIYFFPANLLHTVYAFKTPGERRSFSINFKLKM